MESRHSPIVATVRAPESSYTGFCPLCERNHIFPGAHSHQAGLALMDALQNNDGRFPSPAGDSSLNLPNTTDLFGPARGKMFGVMECVTLGGEMRQIKAFSGQWNTRWEVEGWAPPLFDSKAWGEVNAATEPRIKELGREIESCGDTSRKRRLGRERKALSQYLLRELHSLYRLTNFRGHTVPLFAAIPPAAGIPTGTGDCCAPKLFNYAAEHHLIPLNISEFFWGRENKSGTRQHRRFYGPCREKCGLILGFLLCGLEELYEQYARRTYASS